MFGRFMMLSILAIFVFGGGVLLVSKKSNFEDKILGFLLALVGVIAIIMLIIKG